MAGFVLTDPESNTWKGNLLDFHFGTANSFYARGMVGGFPWENASGPATVHFSAEDFFENFVDVDKKETLTI